MSREIYPMEEKYQEYLTDESKNQGSAVSISFPESEEEIQEIMETLGKENIPVTIQGSMTGIVGGSVPVGGHIMNLQKMKRIEAYTDNDGPTVTLEPGVSLEELEQGINRNFKGKGYFWPPSPTETTASIGGVLATAARGINIAYYEDTRKYVSEIHLVDGMGKLHILDKSSLDTVIGSEGLYGVITKATLLLEKKPEENWGITFFFEELAQVNDFVNGIEEIEDTPFGYIVAMEYVDRASIDLVESKKEFMTKIKELPDVEPEFNHLLYIEIGGKEDAITQIAEKLMELVIQCDGNPDKAWAVMGEAEIQRMRAFHHSVAECTNLFIEEARRNDDRITKLESDMALPGLSLKECVEFYTEAAKANNIDITIFGHVEGRYLHANILPKNYDEYERGRRLLSFWNQKAYKKYKKITVEHGIGKVKSDLAGCIFTKDQIAQIEEQKRKYDPNRLLNRGNILSEDAYDKDCSVYEAGSGL